MSKNVKSARKRLPKALYLSVLNVFIAKAGILQSIVY